MFHHRLAHHLPLPRRVTLVVVGLLVSIALAGCTINPDATPISMFPTQIPRGTGLPTFASFNTPAADVVTQVPSQATLRPTVTFRFVATPVPAGPAAPTALPTLDSNWTPLANGIEWRRLSFTGSDNANVGVLIVRIDPSLNIFKASYTFGEVHMIQDWHNKLPGALVLVNANYFDTNNRPIGLVGVDGVLNGASIARSDAGLFQVVNGVPSVRSLWIQPFNNTEHFDQVVQGFPMLMISGQVAPAFDADLSSVRARRTVLASDRQGHILFIVTPFANVSLGDLSRWLGASGLDIDSALNVDGGQSTGMYMATGGPSAYTLDFAPVPVVVGVYAR